jgi:hypothetical protein
MAASAVGAILPRAQVTVRARRGTGRRSRRPCAASTLDAPFIDKVQAKLPASPLATEARHAPPERGPGDRPSPGRPGSGLIAALVLNVNLLARDRRTRNGAAPCPFRGRG